MENRTLLSAFFTLMLSVILLGTFKFNVFAEEIPKVAIVSLEHVPFVQGDNNSFYISAKNYTGDVQYQLFYIQESVMKDWKLVESVGMTNGWTKASKAQEPIIVDISNLNLKADYYRFAIRVKRVGVKGLKENPYGDYDDAYPFTQKVEKDSIVRLNGEMNIKKSTFTKNENLIIDGVGNSLKGVQYKLHLFDVKRSEWVKDLTEYTINTQLNLKSIPAGTYIVDLWVKDSNSTKNYDGWKLKVINIINDISNPSEDDLKIIDIY
jgi:hypothetical protein